MKMKFGDFLTVGERGYNLERLFNLREGMKKDDDTLPKRLTDEQQIPGQEKTKVPLGKMLPKYYRLRGWDINGVPTKRRLKKLQLDDIVGSAV
jgi:aldehyde:ferredoxin oxidoreductase